jgi:Spy/CpxP family protein refolding chaperone
MKFNRNVGLLVLAMASIGTAAGVASAQTTTPSTTTTTTAPATGHKWHGHHHGGFMLGMTLRATKQLNLTADQQASIKTILTTARAQAKAAHAAAGTSTVDMSVLANPGDANYATALQTAKTASATRIQNESEIQGQIYNVLTAAQKAQLPTVLASMKAQAAARRAAWEQKHAASTTGAG